MEDEGEVAISKTKPLSGRREDEQAIESRRRLEMRFCVARLSIDNIPAMAAQFACRRRLSLMDQVGQIIRQHFEEADLICRWSDNDLVAITDLNLPEVATCVSDVETTLKALIRAVPGRSGWRSAPV